MLGGDEYYGKKETAYGACRKAAVFYKSDQGRPNDLVIWGRTLEELRNELCGYGRRASYTGRIAFATTLRWNHTWHV